MEIPKADFVLVRVMVRAFITLLLLFRLKGEIFLLNVETVCR